MTIFFYITIILFCLGLVSVFIKKDLVSILLCLEIVLAAVFLMLVLYSRHINDIQGQVQALLLCVIMVAQFVVGASAIFILFYNKTITKDDKLLNGLD